jgi:uncharacterized protein (DUF1697 family)
MTKKVALMRGVNVGGRSIKMADLKNCLEEAGFEEVKTYLQSGNVTFDSDESVDKLRPQLEDIVSKRFGYEAKIFVYDAAFISKVIEEYPFDTTDKTYQHYIVFTGEYIASKLNSSAPKDESMEKVALGRGVIYWTVEKGRTLGSSFSKYLSKVAYKDKNTVRNINTLLKISGNSL